MKTKVKTKLKHYLLWLNVWFLCLKYTLFLNFIYLFYFIFLRFLCSHHATRPSQQRPGQESRWAGAQKARQRHKWATWSLIIQPRQLLQDIHCPIWMMNVWWWWWMLLFCFSPDWLVILLTILAVIIILLVCAAFAKRKRCGIFLFGLSLT